MYSRIYCNSLHNFYENNRQLRSIKCSRLRNMKQNNVCVFTRMPFKRPVVVCLLNVSPLRQTWNGFPAMHPAIRICRFIIYSTVEFLRDPQASTEDLIEITNANSILWPGLIIRTNILYKYTNESMF